LISQYLYISTAPDLNREDVDAILASSQRNNPEINVTGMLLYNGRNFLQLLEGEESQLVSLMVKISHDPRHTGISMIDRRLVDQRACGDWNMQRIRISDNIEKRRELLDEQLPAALDDDLRNIVMNFAVLN